MVSDLLVGVAGQDQFDRPCTALLGQGSVAVPTRNARKLIYFHIAPLLVALSTQF